MSRTRLTPRQRIHWVWKSDTNAESASKNEQWIAYSDVETAMIEESYKNKVFDVILDGYNINLEKMIQISNTDKTKQWPIKRISKEISMDVTKLRETRFLTNPMNPAVPFTKNTNILRYTTEVLTQFNLFDDSGLEDPDNLRKMVEKAAEGIVSEGKSLGKQREATWIARKLLSVKDGTKEEIWRCCAHLYTMESFLYKEMIEHMRLTGDEKQQELWKSKILIFGPLAHLLSSLTFDKNYRKMTVYRATELSDDMIKQYDQNENEYVIFSAFTSTCRDQKKAEQYGNVLFIIDISSLDATDLSPFSDYPEEEEILIKAEFAFYIQYCRYDKTKQKWLIHLSAHKDD